MGLTAALTGKPKVKRSGSWPRVRREHLADFPACACCGSTKELEVHHVWPVHLFPMLELTKSNLLTLCDRCHLMVGHLYNWHSYNRHAKEDAATWLAKIQARP